MLETRRGSEDGFVVRRFHKDHHYDIADTLAQAFIRNKSCEPQAAQDQAEINMILRNRLCDSQDLQEHPMFIPYDPYLRPDPLRTARNRLLMRMTAPATEPLTLAEAKLYLRIDNTHEDTLITDLIVAVRMIAESWLGRSLITQSWKLAYDYGIPENVWLPMGPVSAITSLVIVNRDSTTQTVDSGAYWLNAAQNALMMVSMLIGFRIEITYGTGYGNAAALPRPIKQGLLTHLAAMYDSRGESGEVALPEQTVALYMPFREVRL